MAELTGGGLDLRRSDGSVWLWIARGWLDDPADVRGVDTVIPGKEGRTARDRKRDFRTIELRGQIVGQGATEAAADADYLALVQALNPLFFDLTVAPWALVAGDLYRGLGVGQTATINVRPVNVVPAANQLTWRRAFTFELVSIDSPPEWVIAP